MYGAGSSISHALPSASAPPTPPILPRNRRPQSASAYHYVSDTAHLASLASIASSCILRELAALQPPASLLRPPANTPRTGPRPQRSPARQIGCSPPPEAAAPRDGGPTRAKQTPIRSNARKRRRDGGASASAIVRTLVWVLWPFSPRRKLTAAGAVPAGLKAHSAKPPLPLSDSGSSFSSPSTTANSTPRSASTSLSAPFPPPAQATPERPTATLLSTCMRTVGSLRRRHASETNVRPLCHCSTFQHVD